MPAIVYDDAKGFCFDSSLQASKVGAEVISNGFDQLPWEIVLPENPMQEDPEVDPEAGQGGPKKRLSKLEKKEIKQQKKINAARARQVKRQQQIGSESAMGSQIFNPFLAKSDLKQLHSRIISHVKTESSSQVQSSNTSSELKILQYQSIALYKSDLDHILPGEWLNDNNISFVYELIHQTFLKEKGSFNHQVQLLFPSLVQLFLHFPVSDEIENILPLDDLKKLKFIFIPINFIDDYDDIDLEEVNNGDHWALGLLSVLENRLYIYDSMTIDEGDSSTDKLLGELTRRLQSCKGILKSNRPIEVIKMKCDQQDNFDDCGVFLVMITCYLIKRLILEKEAISLDISKVRFNALAGRVKMMELIGRVLWSETEPTE
ncbi:cysteine proteinase [Suhomyces tanzawaensis NRRL Y-17324]|uniref:Cysteine proteinase n=1 Tax=Suhomyces tanzawaensis NRRL Y-17324 TaxID=984487 RepID=A0A1E4SI71_9ASCO|nr:cysteine proteinase [Suhomyces tanzawaensis NRRL Y-17324]ODV79214.1 cysteine proteinase [Suhomyces tanzawaensis NRRL Y-17324]